MASLRLPAISGMAVRRFDIRDHHEGTRLAISFLGRFLRGLWALLTVDCSQGYHRLKLLRIYGQRTFFCIWLNMMSEVVISRWISRWFISDNLVEISSNEWLILLWCVMYCSKIGVTARPWSIFGCLPRFLYGVVAVLKSDADLFLKSLRLFSKHSLFGGALENYHRRNRWS